jgi:prepilin-type N-terminal cleavage/methylation domain-containing protein
MTQSKRQSGFTIVELLVVISIISLLLSMLLPSLSAARQLGKVAQCLSNRHQLYVSVAVYSNEFGAKLPNRGTSLAACQTTIWSLARWHSDTELQNDVRVGTVTSTDTGQRYWGLGCLWTGNYLGDGGRTLFCTDYINRRYISGQDVSYDQTMVEANKTLVLDDPNNWARTPSTTAKNTCWVSPWFLTEGIAPVGIASTNLATASTFDGRKANLTFFTDGYFQGGTGWSNAVPHDRTGIVMVTTDGRGTFFKNPRNAQMTDWGQGHPWEIGLGGVSGYSAAVIGYQ